MRHILAVLAVGVLLFLGLNSYYNTQLASAQDTTAAVITVVDARADSINVGILLNTADTMDGVYFRNNIKNNLPDNCNVHVAYTNGDVETQMAMFRKMVSEGYRLVLMEIFDPSVVDAVTEIAVHQNIALVFTGEQPSEAQLAAGERLYYLGSTEMDCYTSLSNAVTGIWGRAASLLDKNLDGTLKYSALSGHSYTGSTSQLHFESQLADAGIEYQLVDDSITESFSYDINDALAKIAEDGTELLICESSSDAYQAWQYYHDAEIYEVTPTLEIMVAGLDDGAQKLIDDGSVLVAAGSDSEELGIAGAKLCVAILTGSEINRDTIGVQPEGNCVICSNKVLVSKRVEAYLLANLNLSAQLARQ